MIRISQAVVDLVLGDEIALEALRAGILNLSAYADRILPTVEKSLYKEVRKGSIVTALSRLSHHVSNAPKMRASVLINDMNIKAPLCELSYEKSILISQKVSHLVSTYSQKGLFTVTQGIGEVTLIILQEIKSSIIKAIGVKPTGQYDDLAAITVRFAEEEYIEVPNMIYTLVAALAGKRINLIEVVSTFTEISFIVREKDMKQTIEVFKNNFFNQT